MDNVNEAPPYATNIQTETQIDTLTGNTLTSNTLTGDTLIFDIPCGSNFQLDRGSHQSEQEQHQGGSEIADTLDPSVPPSHQDQSSLPRLDKQVEEFLETLAPLPAISAPLLTDPFLSSSGPIFTREPQLHQEGFAIHQEETSVDHFNQTEGPTELQRIFYGKVTRSLIEVHCEPKDIISPGHNTPGWYR